MPIGIASAHDLAIAQAAINRPPSGSGRFVPTISAPKLKTTAWHPPALAQSPSLSSSQGTSKAFAADRTLGEQADLRTQNSSTFLNADGTWTVQSYAQPIHYQDAHGNWQTIDTSVVSDTSDAGLAYGNKANSWHVHFASSASAKRLAHAQFPGADVTEALQGAASVPGVASGSQMVYATVFPGVDLQYTLMKAHVEETLLLHNASGPLSYSFTYHIPGVSAQVDARGNVVFTDAKGNAVFVIGGVSMYEADAQGQRLPTGRGTDNVHVTLSGSGPDFTITYTPDHTWLTAAGRVFPVAIDPSWSGADPHSSSSSGNIYGDTFDESANPTWAFYTDPAERIGNFNVNPPGYNTGTNRAYIKFPIGGAPANNLRITSASLTLWQTSSYAGNVQIIANAITSSWNETTLTWNTHPTGFVYGGTGNASTSYNVNISLNVADAAYAWWGGRLGVNGFELQYANESQAGNFFASDDYGTHLPSLTINYTQDTTTPTGGVTINGGSSPYTGSTAVTLTPSYADTGATNEWNSNWSTVNGVTKITTGNGSDANQPAAWSVDGAGSQLISDTSKCGTSSCWVQTYFSHTIGNMANYPTFTAMFKTDYLNDFEFGAENSANAGTRFMLHANATGFVSAMVSKSAGSWSSYGMSYALSPNTWYYGQVDFPLSNVGEIFIWPVGQARPVVPTYYATGITMANPGLIFQHNGDNGANLHRFYVANVVMTSKGSGSTGFGVWGMEFSNNGSTWSCPAPGSGTWCVAAGRQTGWNLSSGDGKKTVSVRYVDNAGNVQSSAGFNQIILDTTPPTASVTTPTAGREVRGQVIVTGTAADPSAPDGSAGSGLYNPNNPQTGVWLYVDGVATGQAVANTSVPTFIWDTTNWSAGEHTITIVAVDALSNRGASTDVTVDVANTGQMPYELFATRSLPAGSVSVGINAATGNLLVQQGDIDIPARGIDLTLGRTYNTLAPTDGLFGMGWTSDLDVGLISNADGTISYHDASGGLHLFSPNGNGGYTASPGVFTTLVRNADSTFTLTSKDQTRTNFNVAGYLTSIVDRNGNTVTVAYDEVNQPTAVTDSAGRQLALTVTNGHVTSIAAPGDRTYGYAYDSNGNLTNYTDPAGTITHFAYDSSHRMTSVTLNDVSGGAQDQQTNVTTTFTYDSSNRIVSLVDPLGYDVGVGYGLPYLNSGGVLVGGQVTVEQLETNANTTPATSSSVYETTTYTAAADGSGAIAQVAAPSGSTYYWYDSNDEVTKTVDPNNAVSTRSYDGNGNITSSVVDPGNAPHLNLITGYSYDVANNLLTETSPSGVVTQYTYDSPSTGNLVQKVVNYVSGGPNDSQTNVTSTYSYDSYGDPVAKTDPLGVVTQYTYDSQGDLLITTANYKPGVPSDNQTNVISSNTYDELGERLTATDPLGVVTQYTYDIRGNLMQSVDNYQAGVPADNQTNVATNYGYDALGRLVSSTDPLGVLNEQVYDADGRVVQSIQNYVNGGPSDSQTNVMTTTAYDAASNPTLVTDPKGNTTTTTYDDANRATEVVKTSSASSGATQVSDQVTTYDADGHVTATQAMDGMNNPKTTTSYDAAGRQVTVTEPPANPGATDASGQSNITTLSYDNAGNVVDTKVTNAAVSGDVSDTTATYNSLSQPTAKTEQAGSSAAQTTTYTYDKNGQQATQTDASGTSSVDRDALGRVVTAWHPDGSQDTTSYDKAGHTLASSDGVTTTTYTYDPVWRVSSEQVTDNSTGKVQQTTSYAYDANGNELTPITTYADGTQSGVVYTYDKLGHLTGMNDGTRSYTYDTNGNLSVMKVLSGGAAALEEDFSYDGGNRPVGLTDKIGTDGWAFHTYSYAYDARGNASQIVTDGVAVNYVYDDADQLTQVTDSAGSLLMSYTYDANHNRLSMTTSTGTTSYAYDAGDVTLQSKTDPNGKVTTYQYDASGDLSTAAYDPTGANQVTQYAYNSKDLLSELDKPDGSKITFTYDADGNRLSKTVVSGGPVPTQTMVKDVYQDGRIAYETDGAGTTLATFSYDPNGTPTSVVVGSDPTNGPRYYYVYDAHGNVVALADTAGNVVANYSYDEYGNLTNSYENLPNGWTNPYRFDGIDRVRYDSETNLYWMSVRAYDPTLGRFISRDPQGRTPTVWATQPYAYAGNNPLRNVDPSGQRFVDPDNPGFWIPMPRPGKGSGAITTTPGGNPTSGQPGQHTTCDPNHPLTLACYQWMYGTPGGNKGAYYIRQGALRQLDASGYLNVIEAGGLDAIGLILAAQGENNTGKFLEMIFQALDFAANLFIPAIGHYWVDTHPGSGPVFSGAEKVAMVINELAGLVNVAIGWWKTANWLLKVALNGAILAVKAGAEGVPGVLEDVTWQLFAGAMSFVAFGFADQLLAISNATFMKENDQNDMDIVAWCNQYGGGSCGPLPTN